MKSLEYYGNEIGDDEVSALSTCLHNFENFKLYACKITRFTNQIYNWKIISCNLPKNTCGKIL